MEVSKSPRESQPLIEFNDVNIVRNSRKLLDGINLCINSGEHVAILGPNGAGKSSLIKTITREYYPQAKAAGSNVRILGEMYWDVFELRSHLGIVTGDVLRSTFRDFSCFEMILSGFFSSIGIWQYQEVTPEMINKVEEIMEFLGIAPLRSRSINEISTGEGRLILIGRALVHNPPTLLLDEPTSSLDPRATFELRQTLRKIAGQGKSLIMITHNLSDIIPEINRIILISKGKIVEDGRKERVLTSESLSRLFGIHIELMKHDDYYYHW